MAEELKGEAFVKAQQAQQGNGTPKEQPADKPAIQLYIIKTKISNENFVEKSEEINLKQRLYTYKFTKKDRDSIKAIRMRYKAPIYDGTLNFYGLYVCGEDAKEFIQKAIDAADAEFGKLRVDCIQSLIDEKAQAGELISQATADQLTPHLGAKIRFIPLDFNQIFKGSLYAEIGDAIKYQVYSGLFARMETMLKRTEEGKELPERSRNALIKMCESMRSINVTKDDNIYKKIDEFKAQIEKGELKEVAASLKAELDAGKSRWAAIEL